MRTLLALALLAAIVAPLPTRAALTQAELGRVGVEVNAGTRLPLAAIVEDISGRSATLGEMLEGRPALLVPVDYRCRVLCGPALAVLAPVLQRAHLRMGRDFTVLVLGIDPRDGVEDAVAITKSELGGPADQPGLHVLRADQKTTSVILGALGYRAAFDPALDRFAHPAAAFAISPDGGVVRTLSTLALDEKDLDLAMTEAAGGHASGLPERLVLLCYGFDPARGVYTPAIGRLLTASGILTLAGIGGFVAFLRGRARRVRGAP